MSGTGKDACRKPKSEGLAEILRGKSRPAVSKLIEKSRDDRPLLAEVFGPGAYLERTLIVDCGDESLLAPLLRDVTAVHPGVYIKSRASSFGPDVTLHVTLAVSGASSEEAEACIAQAAHDLTTMLRSKGIHGVIA